MFSSIKFEEGVRRTQSFRTTANVKKEEAVSKIDLSTEKEQKKKRDKFNSNPIRKSDQAEWNIFSKASRELFNVKRKQLLPQSLLYQQSTIFYSWNAIILVVAED